MERAQSPWSTDSMPVSQSDIRKKKQKLEQYATKKLLQSHRYSSSKIGKQSTFMNSGSRFYESPLEKLRFSGRNMMTGQNNRIDMFREQHKANIQDAVSEKMRPFTQAKTRRQRAIVNNPLEIIRTRSQNQTSLPRNSKSSFSQKSLRSFLKKGTSLHKKIFQNILLSKINPNTHSSIFNYTVNPQNKNLIQEVQKQIPLGLRDIVGCEEMIRMCHICAGTNFKNSNLNGKIRKFIEENHKGKDLEKEESDNATLKSIKRW